LVPIEVHYMEKNPGMFSSKTLISFRLKKEWVDILDDMGVSKLSAKVNYSFKGILNPKNKSLSLLTLN